MPMVDALIWVQSDFDEQSVRVATAARLWGLHEVYPPREEDRHDLELLGRL